MNGLTKTILLSVVLFLSIHLCAQEQFRVMFYNVENLYDTINNPQTADDDITPEGNLHWNSYRYHKKLEDISKVISSIGGKYPPAMVGLCEVENDFVLKDLTQSSSLARHKYHYVLTKSKDARGSNIAFLYQRDQLKLISHKSYTPVIDKESNRTTRDILHITGKVVNGDTIDIFVCHYPSRREGIARSRPFRIAVSELLRQKIDSIFGRRRNPNIIVMGDFNDYPHDTSIKTTLGAQGLTDKVKPNILYNLCQPVEQQGKPTGSYKYNGKWGFIDQIIVNGNLLNRKRNTHIINKEAQVYAPDYLLDYDEKYGGKKPLRTFSGWKYLEGTSDHLPLYIDLFIRE